MPFMWMAELSSRSGLPVPTIKYYLREGLLHPGEATGATRARYDESHVQRLRLIRALTEVARLRLETVRQVLADLHAADSWHDAVGSAHGRLSPLPDRPPTAAALSRVQELLDRQGWDLAEESPHRLALATALDAMAELGRPVSDRLLDRYAAAMRDVAEAEIGALPDDREAAAEMAVIGTVLLEPALLSVRRIAEENASRAHTR
jgi:DNA-binding transcriptional MerR regulator